MDGGNVVADVHYRLTIDQEVHVMLRDGEEIPGLKRITGRFTVLEGARDLGVGNNFVLRLEDDREWGLITKSMDPFSGEYTAMNAGGISDKLA